jgi:5-methyltetrahydrofolate--homocysteine methyltransferase
MSDLGELQAEFVQLFLAGDSEAASARARQVIDEGVVDATRFFEGVFSPAMETIGGRFGRLEIFLPELIDAADMAKGVSENVIRPRLIEATGVGVPTHGTVVLASVRGDLHDIGKNMVALMLQVNGFDVIDMGVNVGSRAILDRAVEVKADIIGLSALMTTSTPYMKEVVDMLKGLGLKGRFAVIVGGAPLTPAYAREIGADAFGENAADAVAQCLALMDRQTPAR